MLSLALGVRVLKVQTLYGATQWRNPRLGSFVSIGPLQLLTAFTPSHTVVRTLTWRLRLRRFLVEAALISTSTSSDAPPATHMLDVDDDAALIALQRDLEAGIPYAIVGQPTVRGSIVQVPHTEEQWSNHGKSSIQCHLL